MKQYMKYAPLCCVNVCPRATVFLENHVEEGGRVDVEEGGRADLGKKMKGKLNTCANFHQTQGISFPSSASSWPPSWKTTTEKFCVSQAHVKSRSQISRWIPQSCPQSLKTRRARKSNKMAEISDKNVNILSRFTKLPDKNQATVLVSLEIILSWGVSCFFLPFFHLSKFILFPSISSILLRCSLLVSRELESTGLQDLCLVFTPISRYKCRSHKFIFCKTVRVRVIWIYSSVHIIVLL